MLALQGKHVKSRKAWGLRVVDGVRVCMSTAASLRRLGRGVAGTDGRRGHGIRGGMLALQGKHVKSRKTPTRRGESAVGRLCWTWVCGCDR